MLPLISNFIGNFTNWFNSKRWFSSNASFQLGQKGPVWLDTTKTFLIYSQSPQIKTVIDRKAAMFSNMELRLVDADDEEIDESAFAKDLKALLENPNIFQSFNEFLYQYKQLEQIYGNAFILKNVPSTLSTLPISLICLSPMWTKPMLTGKAFDQVRIEDVVSEYEYTQGGLVTKYPGISVLWNRVNAINNPLIGESNIINLKFPISNIEKAYEFRNVIMAEHGALGLLSNESNDKMGSIALTAEDKKEIDDGLAKRYGISEGKAKIMYTSANLKWQAMAFPTKDLLLFEEVDANLLTIVDSFGLNINIFSSKNATFENVKQAILQCYQDTIQPEADKFAQALGKFLKIPKGTRLVACFDHLSIYKENKEKGQAAIVSMVNYLTSAITAGIISVSEAQTILGNELGLTLVGGEIAES